MPLPAIELSEAISRAVEAVSPSVVRVERAHRRPVSGLVISPRRVVTVARGLAGPNIQLGIEGAVHSAKLRGVDPSTDLALLEVQHDLPATELNVSDEPKVGRPVLKLARPGRTVRATSGIISAVGKVGFSGADGGVIDRYLEADALHFPGFSGGPLVAVDGALLGITSTAIVRGHSLTIPSSTVHRVVEQLEAHGHVRRSYLGVEMRPVHLPDDVSSASGEEIGLLITAVEKNGPADSAGIRYGDTLLHLGTDDVRTLDDLQKYLRADRVGQQVPAKLWRHGQVEHLNVTLGERPQA